MSAAAETATTGDRELVLTRHIDAPRAAVYRCWTDAALLKRWIAPRPWTATQARLDVRPGGEIFFAMRSPEGEEMPCPGVYLEVVENERLVTTDAYVRAWEPSEKPFMTLILTFEDEGEGTRYTVRIRHWSVEGRRKHEEMGFEDGWGRCTDQLAELAATL